MVSPATPPTTPPTTAGVGGEFDWFEPPAAAVVDADGEALPVPVPVLAGSPEPPSPAPVPAVLLPVKDAEIEVAVDKLVVNVAESDVCEDPDAPAEEADPAEALVVNSGDDKELELVVDGSVAGRVEFDAKGPNCKVVVAVNTLPEFVVVIAVNCQ